MDVFDTLVKGYIDDVKELLSTGVDPNMFDEYNRTPLWWAVYYKRLQVAELLLETGADPNVKDKDGRTPLYNARKFEKMAKLLLDNGADPNIRDNKGKTFLHIECARYDRKLVKLLLDNGADPNIADKNGETPLFYVWNSGFGLIEELDVAGANINHLNHKNKSHLYYVLKSGNLKLTKELLQLGASVLTNTQVISNRLDTRFGDMVSRKKKSKINDFLATYTPSLTTLAYRSISKYKVNRSSFLTRLAVDS